MYSGYELCENEPYPGKEGYTHSEKYELKNRALDEPGNIKPFIALLNQARRENPALQLYDNLVFHPADHSQVLCYSRATPDLGNRILVVVSLDLAAPVETMVHLNLHALGLQDGQTFLVHDLLHGSRYHWAGSSNFVALRPDRVALHLFRIEVEE